MFTCAQEEQSSHVRNHGYSLHKRESAVGDNTAMGWLQLFDVTKLVPLWLVRVAAGVAAVSVCGLAALYCFQEKLLYIPGVPNDYIKTPQDYGISYEDVWLTAADGVKLHCWHLMPNSQISNVKPPVILFFQENAGNMSFRMPFLARLVRHLSTAVFVLGYRGYGKSDGAPTQSGLEMDANAALEHLLQRDDIDTTRIVVVGKSLGGAVALHTAAKHESLLRGAIIENTFLSVEEMVPLVFPFLSFGFGEKRPLNFLVRNKWRNRDQVAAVKTLPVLLIGSKRVRFSRHRSGIVPSRSSAAATS
jgi:abhydrolase domain-containing protein 13